MFRRSTIRGLLVSMAVAIVTTTVLPTVYGQSGITPVTDAMLQNPDADDWLMWRRTLNGWGY